jgi:hypothetical protein
MSWRVCRCFVAVFPLLSGRCWRRTAARLHAAFDAAGREVQCANGAGLTRRKRDQKIALHTMVGCDGQECCGSPPRGNAGLLCQAADGGGLPPSDYVGGRLILGDGGWAPGLRRWKAEGYASGLSGPKEVGVRLHLTADWLTYTRRTGIGGGPVVASRGGARKGRRC